MRHFAKSEIRNPKSEGSPNPLTRVFYALRRVLLTPWLQPGVFQRRTLVTVSTVCTRKREAVETAGRFQGRKHRAEATVLMRAAAECEISGLSPKVWISDFAHSVFAFCII